MHTVCADVVTCVYCVLVNDVYMRPTVDVCVFVCLFVAVTAHCTEWSLSPVLVSGKESSRGQNKLRPRKPRLVGPVKVLLAS